MSDVKVGMKFVRLEVTKQVRTKAWECTCDCGNKVTITSGMLLSGNNKSCGCLKKDITVERNTTHGLSKRTEYSNWKGMHKRCFNENDTRYKDYALRGISIHEDFVSDFPAWLKEIGDKPVDGQKWSIGRIDNNGWYTYGNMRWELDTQQARNHTLQSNNTSGIVGVKLSSKVIAGTLYTAWVASWKSLDGKSHTKNFSTNKFGSELSKSMAIDYRNKIIAALNEQGADYGRSHGSEK